MAALRIPPVQLLWLRIKSNLYKHSESLWRPSKPASCKVEGILLSVAYCNILRDSPAEISSVLREKRERANFRCTVQKSWGKKKKRETS